MPSITSPTPGCYYLRYEGLPYQDGRRRQIRETVYGTEQEARQRLKERLAEVTLARRDKHYPASPSPPITLGAVLSTWLASRDPAAFSPSTLNSYRKFIKGHLIPRLGHLRLTEVTPAAIEEYCRRLREDGARLDGKEGGLSPQTVRLQLRLLSQVLASVTGPGKPLSVNPAQGIKLKVPHHRVPAVLDAAAATKVLAALQGTPYYLPVLLGLATGLRRGELLALRWKHVNPATGVLTVQDSLIPVAGRGVLTLPPKSGRTRTVLIPPGVLALLLAERGEKGPGDYLFLSPTGHSWNPDSFYQCLRRRLRAAGLEVFGIHTLRHSHATLGLGITDIKVMMDRLGHTTSALFLEVYSHALPLRQQEAAAAFDGLLGTTPQPAQPPPVVTQEGARAVRKGRNPAKSRAGVTEGVTER